MNEPLILAAAAALVGFVLAWVIRRPDPRPAQDLARLQADHANLSRTRDEIAANLTEERRHVGTLREDNGTLTARVATLETEARAADRRANDIDARHRATLEAFETARTERHAAQVEISHLTTLLERERIATHEKIELLSTVREDMETRFKQLATDSLRLNGEESGKRLEAALAPLKQHVEHFQTELRNVHDGALKDRAALKTEIETLTRRSEQVSREAVNLTRALKGDKQRQGAWGEMILESILERSGLKKGEEYHVQQSHTDHDGARFRPDVIVHMPDGKRLVIDSKVSLVDYEVCINAEDDTEAGLARTRHVRALKNHISTLADKDYTRMVDGSVDYVVMFIPIEGALSEALREVGDLTTHAFEKSVTIATPTTLMMALRTIANVWMVERRNRNAEAIADRAGRLYEKVAGFVDDMEKVGRNIGAAQSSYGEAMNKLSSGRGNVLSQLETMKSLGARTQKTFRTDFDHDDQPAITNDAAAQNAAE